MVKSLKITRNVNIQDLEKNYHEESDGNIKLRVLMILQCLDGKSANEIAKFLKVDNKTVSLWIKRFNTYGVEGLQDKERSGRPKKVDYEAFKEAMDSSPKNYGYPHEIWFPKLVLQYLKDHQNADIAENYVYKLIKRAGYSLKVPSRKSYKSDENRVILFKQNEKISD